MHSWMHSASVFPAAIVCFLPHIESLMTPSKGCEAACTCCMAGIMMAESRARVKVAEWIRIANVVPADPAKWCKEVEAWGKESR
jgi:hypothetical protein